MTATRFLLPLLLLAAWPAAADWPSHYVLRGAQKGTQGTLDLEDAGKSLVRRKAKLKAVVSLQIGDEELKLSGTLKASGDVFKGDLRSSAGGLGGHLQQLRITPPWSAELTQGMQIKLRLKRGFRTITVTGRAPLGKRNTTNEATIQRFYEAFQRKDAAGMAAEYAPDVHFSDRVFPNLHGDEAGSMWAMLCESEDLTLTFSGVRAGERYGVARWEAHYTVFGNKVHNVIDANFEFGPDGKIVRHVDSFDFKRWASQALPSPVQYVPQGVTLTGIRTAVAIQLHNFRRKQ